MTQRLSIKHLQVLAAFRGTGSLSKIAERLKLTPSAVSRRIDEAESRLGLALFAKASNRVRLTPAGEYILQAAERILADLDRVESVAARLGSDVHHVIRIGMSIYRSFAWFPDFAAYLAIAKPGIRLELAAEDKDELESLKGHGVDIVMTPLVDDFPGTSRVELFADDLVALVAPSHRLAKRRFMRPEDVAPEDFYTYSLAVRPGFEYLEYLLPAHAAPHRYIVVAAPEAAAALARGGQGLTILSKWAVQADLEDGRLIGLPLGERGLKITWGALLRAADGKGTVVFEIAQLLRSFFAQRRQGVRKLQASPGRRPRA
jgi:LysR family transcriptional regulator, regulator for metE and metH